MELTDAERKLIEDMAVLRAEIRRRRGRMARDEEGLRKAETYLGVLEKRAVKLGIQTEGEH